MDYSFRFVCQQGKLEAQSMLLAASLCKFLKNKPAELVACVPEPASVWGSPDTTTLDFLEYLGVIIKPIVNPISIDYPIGNKISCLAVPGNAKTAVFLDSDMLCMNSLYFDTQLDGDVVARAAGHLTWGNASKGENWSDVYACCGVTPEKSEIETAVSGISTPLYLNSGFIAVRKNALLAENWAYCCKLIDADRNIPNKRPWLDQIALPPAIEMTGLEPRLLGIEFNFPPKCQMDDKCLPRLFHYHSTKRLKKNVLAMNVVNALVEEHPQLAEPVLSEFLQSKKTFTSRILNFYHSLRD